MPKYVVRHGVMRNLGVFGTKGNDTFARGDQVIARTHRGLESGEILCEATDDAVRYLNDPKQGQILRRTSDDDLRDLRKMTGRHVSAGREKDYLANRAAKLANVAAPGLPPKQRQSVIGKGWRTEAIGLRKALRRDLHERGNFLAARRQWRNVELDAPRQGDLAAFLVF